MRLRELRFPIAVKIDCLLMGGKDAGLHTERRYNYLYPDYYTDGAYDDATIYDSCGRQFAVEKIYLSEPHLLDKAIGLITSVRDGDSVRVDMDLTQTGQFTLEEFGEEMRKIALANPTWWKRHSSEKEIREMCKGFATFKGAINDIGVLDPPGKEKLKGFSTKVVDLR